MKKETFSNQVLDSMVAEHPDCFLLLDRENRILRASKAAQKIYGYPAAELYEMKFDDLMLRGSTAHTSPWAESFCEFFRQKNGEIVPMEVKTSGFRVETDSYTMVIAREISRWSLPVKFLVPLAKKRPAG